MAKIKFLLCVAFALANSISLAHDLQPFQDKDSQLWGLKNSKGKVVAKPEFQAVLSSNPKESLISVIKDNRAYRLNSKGKVKFEAYFFDNGPDYYEQGLARFIKKGKIGFHDAKGNVKIAAKYDFATPFENGRSIVCNGCVISKEEHGPVTGGKWGAINLKGHVVVPIKLSSWDEVSSSKTSTPDLGFDAGGLKKLEAAMEQFVTKNKVKGLSMLLARHGKVASMATFGEMKDDSIVRIYSMTKPITGVAMMILFEEGKWRLEDPITKFIPEFKDLRVMSGVDAKGNMTTVPVTRPPTLREIMSHTAGFAYGFSADHPVDRLISSSKVLDSSSLQEMIGKLAKIPLKFQPGTDWEYSLAVDIQGYLVEKLSGQKFGDFLSAKIFKPLKMSDTDFQTRKDKASRLVPVYATNPKTGSIVEVNSRPDGTPVPPYLDPPQLQSGGGGLVSTLKDYGRFSQMILNGGELDGVRIMSADSVKLMGTNVLSKKMITKLDNNKLWNTKGAGFGLDFMVMLDPVKNGDKTGKGTMGWGGAAGTWFWIDHANDLYFVGLVQTFDADTKADLRTISRKLTHEALVNPKK